MLCCAWSKVTNSSRGSPAPCLERVRDCGPRHPSVQCPSGPIILASCLRLHRFRARFIRKSPFGLSQLLKSDDGMRQPYDPRPGYKNHAMSAAPGRSPGAPVEETPRGRCHGQSSAPKFTSGARNIGKPHVSLYPSMNPFWFTDGIPSCCGLGVLPTRGLGWICSLLTFERSIRAAMLVRSHISSRLTQRYISPVMPHSKGFECSFPSPDHHTPSQQTPQPTIQ